MRKYLLASLILLFFSCQTNDVSEKENLKQVEYYDKTIELLSKKISLNSLENNEEGFEVRIWEPLLNDTFPVALKRLYLYDDIFRGDIFIFSNNNRHVIRSSKEINLDSITYSKYEIKKIPAEMLDSLRDKLSLIHVGDFDKDLFSKEVEQSLWVNMPLSCLIEEANGGKYKRVLIPIPKYFPQYKSMMGYHTWYSFIEKRVFDQDAGFQEWYESHLKKVFGEEN